MRKLAAVLGAVAILAACSHHAAKRAALPGLGPLDTTSTSPFGSSFFATTTSVSAPTTSVAPATTTTTSHTTTTHPAVTATTVASGPTRICSPGDLGVSLSADHPTYTAGQAINLATTIVNRSVAVCDIGRDPRLTIFDPGGKTVASQLVTVFTGTATAGRIGPRQTRIATLTWFQNTCGGTRCPTGVGYSAVIDLGDIMVPAAKFTLA